MYIVYYRSKQGNIRFKLQDMPQWKSFTFIASERLTEDGGSC